MDGDGVAELWGWLSTLDVPTADEDTLREALTGVHRVRAWCDAFELRAARRLAEITVCPEAVLAEAGRTRLRHGELVAKRAKVTDEAPALVEALATGVISSDHIDELGVALRRLPPAERRALAARGPELVARAAEVTPEVFARWLHTEVARLETESGMDRLARQKRAARLKSGFDNQTGMWWLRAQLDPATGVIMEGRIANMVETLFAEATPPEAPDDPTERHAWRRAQALVALTEGAGGKAGRPEVIIVIDTTITDVSKPVIDWGLPADLPDEVLQDLAAKAKVWPVLFTDGKFVHAEGDLNLGRESRTASKAQRRALRAMHATCGIPGCRVPFQNTFIYHVIWWDPDGLTDLNNLIPLCWKHHHLVHDQAWVLTMTPTREVTLTPPSSRAPPHEGAA